MRAVRMARTMPPAGRWPPGIGGSFPGAGQGAAVPARTWTALVLGRPCPGSHPGPGPPCWSIMSHLLLILVLFSDPSGEKAAQVVTDELARIGGKQVEVVLGADAIKRLEGLGMKVQDLVVAPSLAN